MSDLSHINSDNQPEMVDVGAKSPTFREAEAKARIRLPAAIWEKLQGNEILGKKGPVFQTAILAGTMACKKTSDLIPLCHPLPIENCRFRVDVSNGSFAEIYCRVSGCITKPAWKWRH